MEESLNQHRSVVSFIHVTGHKMSPPVPDIHGGVTFTYCDGLSSKKGVSMVYISLGSNLGIDINNLRTAAAFLIQSYLRNTTCSIVLETEAILPKNAPIEWNKPFLNMIISGETELSPHELLAALKSIETEMGRPQSFMSYGHLRLLI